MAIVYRFENADHIGPYYNTEYVVFSPLNTHNDSTHHPEPGEEGEPWYGVNVTEDLGLHLCGFISLAQMEAWFKPHEIEWMAGSGFHLCTYEVPDEHIMMGNKQITFHRGHASCQGRCL